MRRHSSLRQPHFERLDTKAALSILSRMIRCMLLPLVAVILAPCYQLLIIDSNSDHEKDVKKDVIFIFCQHHPAYHSQTNPVSCLSGAPEHLRI